MRKAMQEEKERELEDDGENELTEGQQLYAERRKSAN